MSRRRRVLSQEEVDVEYWRQRLAAAVTALDVATDELLESKRRLRVCQARLDLSRRSAPTPITMHPSWGKRNAS